MTLPNAKMPKQEPRPRSLVEEKRQQAQHDGAAGIEHQGCGVTHTAAHPALHSLDHLSVSGPVRHRAHTLQHSDPSSGISLGDALRLPKRHPAWRRREAQSG